jgi:hypothetical protein
MYINKNLKFPCSVANQEILFKRKKNLVHLYLSVRMKEVHLISLFILGKLHSAQVKCCHHEKGDRKGCQP